MPCSNAAKTRNQLKFAGVPQTGQLISAASRPKFTILWRHVEDILLLDKFFPIVDTCLSCKDIAQRSCVMVPIWRIFGSCISSELHAAHFRPALNLHYSHTMCGSMVDIQSATAEIRRGKKKNKLQDKNIMSTSAMQAAIIMKEYSVTCTHLYKAQNTYLPTFKFPATINFNRQCPSKRFTLLFHGSQSCINLCTSTIFTFD